MLTKKDKKIIFDRELLLYFLGILGTSVLVKYFQKVIIDIIQDPVTTVMVEYLGAGIFALIFGYLFYRKSFTQSLRGKKEIITGLKISLPLLLGGYFIVQALKVGELSQVYSIHPVYVVVVALLSSFFFKEKMNLRKLFIILGIVIGIILIKIG